MATRIEKPVVGEMYWDKDGDRCTIEFISRRGDAFGYYEDATGIYPTNWQANDGLGWPLYATDPTKPVPEPIDLARRWKFRNSPNDLIANVTKREYCLMVEGTNFLGTKFSFPVAMDGTYEANHAFDLVPDDELPALDLTKPVRRRDGQQIRNVRIEGNYIWYLCGPTHNYFEQTVPLSGICVAGKEHPCDLLPMVRRDWTQADVPFPRPTFRIIDRNSTNYEYEVFYVAIDGIRMSSTSFVSWPELASDWEYTTDGKTWNRCEVYE